MAISKNKNRGYSLVETVIYLSIFVVVSVLVIKLILSFVSSYRFISVSHRLERSAISAMERMTREIRLAGNVNSGQSVFSSNPGTLSLVANSTTTKFYISGGRIMMDVNGSQVGPLTESSVSVTNLVYHLVSNSNSDAVKIDLTLETSLGGVVKTKNYHDTVVLKGQ